MFQYIKNNLLLIYYRGRRKARIPPQKLLKASFLVTLGPWMVLSIFAVFGRLPVPEALEIGFFIFVLSLIFITPYIQDLSALTFYVEQLSLDRRAKAPPLSFLNNVEELSEAVKKLHGSWEYKKNQLEAIIAENQVTIDSLPDIIMTLDKDFNVIRTNRTAKNIIGAPEKMAEVLENTEIKEALSLVLADGKGRTLNYTLTGSDTADYSVSIERLPFFSRGEISLVIALHDVTELKLTEKTLADFVANASHEIRTPLTSIVGFIETLQNGAKDDRQATDKFLNIMAAQADRISRLVGDLLSLSKLEAGIKTPPTEKVDIAEIIERVKTNSAWSANQKNISVALNIENNIPQITGDSGQLTQVFENLLSNAIKYSHENSEVKISISALKNKLISRRIAGVNQYISDTDFIAVSFTDQSEGIAPEHLPRLTERFYRVDTARSRKMGGTGLGLAIVKHILARHNGFLKIESTLGKGSVFSVLLPLE